MNKARLLWILVAADVLLAFASVGAEAFFAWTLPPSLAEYGRVHWPNPIQLLLLATTVICAFVAWIGLVNFWGFARRLYIVSLAASVLFILYSGPSVTTSIGAVLTDLNALVAGMIVGLVYFSDLAHRFESRSVESITEHALPRPGR